MGTGVKIFKVVDAKQNPIADVNLYATRRSEIRHGHGALFKDSIDCVYFVGFRSFA